MDDLLGPEAYEVLWDYCLQENIPMPGVYSPVILFKNEYFLPMSGSRSSVYSYIAYEYIYKDYGVSGGSSINWVAGSRDSILSSFGVSGGAMHVRSITGPVTHFNY